MQGLEESSQATISRREMLRYLAALGVAGVGGQSAVGPASASHPDQTPSHVSAPTFEKELLERYKPLLLTHDLDVQPSSIHGFVVRSDQENTTALCYWVEYPVQLDKSGFASHIGDHEPFYVFLALEGTTDEYIDDVVYSGYHWMAAESNAPPTDTGEDDGQPRAYVVPEYHHYSIGKARSSPRPGEELPLKDLTQSLPTWLDDEHFHRALAEDWKGRGSPAYNPWMMHSKTSWWRKEGLSNTEEGIRRMWLLFGIRGAEESDLSSGGWW